MQYRRRRVVSERKTDPPPSLYSNACARTRGSESGELQKGVRDMYSVMAKDIPTSPIRDMMVRASMMEDVVFFAVGDPDFPSDDCIIEAAKASLDRRETNYAPGAGVTKLREVYAQYLSEQVGALRRGERHRHGGRHVLAVSGADGAHQSRRRGAHCGMRKAEIMG